MENDCPKGDLERKLSTRPTFASLQDQLTSGLASLAATSKAAAKLVVNQAEYTKICNWNLPRAYAELGKHIYLNHNFRACFSELYSEIDELYAKIESIEGQVNERPAGEQFAGKAKRIAFVAKGKAEIQSSRLRISRAATKLGKAAHEKHGDGCGLTAVTDQIEKFLARCEVLRMERNTISASNSSTNGAKVFVIAVVVACSILFTCCGGIGFLGLFGTDRATDLQDYAMERERTPHQSISPSSTNTDILERNNRDAAAGLFAPEYRSTFSNEELEDGDTLVADEMKIVAVEEYISGRTSGSRYSPSQVFKSEMAHVELTFHSKQVRCKAQLRGLPEPLIVGRSEGNVKVQYFGAHRGEYVFWWIE